MGRALTLIVALLLAVPSHAGMIIRGSGGAPPASPCPSWYASALLSWDGDHTSGTNYACDTAGADVVGTNNGSFAISGSYGETGNGARVDSTTLNSNLEFANTGDAYLNAGGAQTLWMRVYLSDYPADNNVTIFEAVYNNDYANAIAVRIDASSLMEGRYATTAAGYIVTPSGPSTGGWVNIAYAWDYPNQDHAVYNGTGWDDDLNELAGGMDGNPSMIRIGERYTGGVAFDGAKYLNIDKFAIVDGYKTGVPW